MNMMAMFWKIKTLHSIYFWPCFSPIADIQLIPADHATNYSYNCLSMLNQMLLIQDCRIVSTSSLTSVRSVMMNMKAICWKIKKFTFGHVLIPTASFQLIPADNATNYPYKICLSMLNQMLLIQDWIYAVYSITGGFFLETVRQQAKYLIKCFHHERIT